MLKRALLLGIVTVLTLAVSAPWVGYAEDSNGVPAFHPTPPAKGAKLPPILGKGQLWGENDQYPFQSHAYELAAKIEKVIYQQPCYCYCDRGMGHKSLHSCFEGTHGAQCSTCMKELYYSYQMTEQHKTAAEIRKGIIAGEWKKIDLQSAAAMQ
ncbi:MAG TPA: CYCXC family (seleno)protein [Terriglobales bacterium]